MPKTSDLSSHPPLPIGKACREPWRRHFVVIYPLLALILGLVIAQGLNFDRYWTDLLFSAEGNHWRLRNAWLTAQVLHEYGQRFSIAWGVGLLALTASSFKWPRLRPYRRGHVCLCTAIITSLLLVSLSKHLLALPCPWDLARYGGDVADASVYTLHPDKVGGCFPAGHATGGYCLFALYFFARQYRFRHAGYWLLPGAIVGLTFGVTQELRGAHFFSHDLVSAGLCWFAGYLMFRWFFRSPGGAPAWMAPTTGQRR